jgi:hypothetical protein
MAVEPIFKQYRVGTLHAKDLQATRGDFKGWSVLRKQAFVAQICLARSQTLIMGLSMSALKSRYAQRASESDRKRTVTPYTFCFNVIIDWIMRDYRLGGAAKKEGVALIIEIGHENNPEAEQQFYEIRKLHKIDDVLRSISFVPKNDCRAIQLADLFAFYSRRNSAALEKAKREGKEELKVETMLRIITEGLPHRGFVATEFVQKGPDTPSWIAPS